MLFLFNKFHTLVWGCTKIPGGECRRLENRDMELMRWFLHSQYICQKWLAGMLTDVQVGWHDFTVHPQGFSHWKRRADDHDIIRWYHCHYAHVEGWEYKRRAHMSIGALIWVFGCNTFSYTLWEATDPLLQLPQCLSWSEITTLQEGVLCLFICKCPRLSWTSSVSLP